MNESGFKIREAIPRVFCMRPQDHMWQWLASFVKTNLPRLQELGRVDAAWCKKLTREFQAAEANPQSLMVSPLILEIVAERL